MPSEIKNKPRLGVGAFALLLLALAGFLPAAVFFLQHGEWRLDPFYMANKPQHLDAFALNAHSGTAICWALGAFVQVASGVRWLPRRFHRPLGYVLAFLGLLGFCSGIALVAMSATPFPQAVGAIAVDHFAGGAMALLDLLLAVVRARQKRFPEHAQAAFFCIAWASYPGASRLVGFLFEYACPCGLIFFSGWEALTVVLIAAVALYVCRGGVSSGAGRCALCVNAGLLCCVALNDFARALRRREALHCAREAAQVWRMLR